MRLKDFSGRNTWTIKPEGYGWSGSLMLALKILEVVQWSGVQLLEWMTEIEEKVTIWNKKAKKLRSQGIQIIFPENGKVMESDRIRSAEGDWERMNEEEWRGEDRNKGGNVSKSREYQTAKVLQEKGNNGLKVAEGSKEDIHLTSGPLVTWNVAEKTALDGGGRSVFREPAYFRGEVGYGKVSGGNRRWTGPNQGIWKCRWEPRWWVVGTVGPLEWWRQWEVCAMGWACWPTEGSSSCLPGATILPWPSRAAAPLGTECAASASGSSLFSKHTLDPPTSELCPSAPPWEVPYVSSIYLQYLT